MNTSVLGFRKTPVAIMSMDERRQVVSRFSVENVLSHSVKKIRSGESFSVSLFSGIKKIYASEVYVRTFDFLSKIFLTVLKSTVWEPFRVSLISGTEKVND